MKKILLMILLVMAFCVPVNAQIRTSHDDFSNVSLIISETLDVGKFNSVELIKQSNGNNSDGVGLLIKCKSSNPPYFKDQYAEIKIDNDIYSLDCINTKVWPNENGTTSTSGSYNLSNYIIKKLLNGNNVIVRVYLYGNDAYETFTVSPDMLIEWKQILNTNL